MKQNYNIRAEINFDAIRHFSDIDRSYVREKIKGFDWSSLPELPKEGDVINFLGEVNLEVTIGERWLWIVDESGLYTIEPGIWYSLLIDKVEIIEDNRRKL